MVANFDLKKTTAFEAEKRTNMIEAFLYITRIQRQIAATNKQIDNLVYKLYNLTYEEIKIVEGTDNLK